jgi:hypothetical protein
MVCIHPSYVKTHLDVLPMLREIVYGDDMQEQAYNIALEINADDVVLDLRKRRSRRLAGAGKESYKRYLDMEKEVADAIRESGKGLLPLLKDGELVERSTDNLAYGGDYQLPLEHIAGSQLAAKENAIPSQETE